MRTLYTGIPSDSCTRMHSVDTHAHARSCPHAHTHAHTHQGTAHVLKNALCEDSFNFLERSEIRPGVRSDKILGTHSAKLLSFIKEAEAKCDDDHKCFGVVINFQHHRYETTWRVLGCRKSIRSSGAMSLATIPWKQTPTIQAVEALASGCDSSFVILRPPARTHIEKLPMAGIDWRSRQWP